MRSGYTDVVVAVPGFAQWMGLALPVEPAPSLTRSQRQRYAKHVALREVGAAGQVRLLGAKVLVLGVGGLGSPAVLYLVIEGRCRCAR